MANPFEDEAGPYLALRNAEGQYSLWPAQFDTPPGWTPAFRGPRQDTLAYIEEHWVDMRPASLATAMGR